MTSYKKLDSKQTKSLLKRINMTKDIEIDEIEECPDMEDSSEETYLEIFEEECDIGRNRVDIVELKNWDFQISPLE